MSARNVLALSVGFAIVVLVGWKMVIPVRTINREAAHLCLSRLKQIGMGMTLYVQDHDGRFPGRDGWMDATIPYLKSEELFHCPDVEAAGVPAIYGYAFNRDLSLAKPPEAPASTALVFDSMNLARNASGGLDSLPNPPRTNGNHVAYADGHASGLGGG